MPIRRAGLMGEVYRARDTRLKRDVAIEAGHYVVAGFSRTPYRPVKVACPLKTDWIAAAAHRSPSAPAETPIAPMT